MLQEIYQPNPQYASTAAIKSMDEYHALMNKAKEDYEGFWGSYAKEKIDWFKPFDTVLNESEAPFYKWFEGGQLNVAHQCIDRHF